MIPRTYTYKITFDDAPFWYWGAHKEKKFGEIYLGTPVTHKWAWDFYTPRIQILEFFDTWGEAREVENRLIFPDLNNPLCLNEAVGFTMSEDALRRGGLAATKVAKEKSLGFYGPKTEKQLESSIREGAKLKQYSVENGVKTGSDNVKLRRGIWGMSKEELLESASAGGRVGGRVTGAQKWEDPSHPELGWKPACVLVQMQRRRGYPSEPENRVRVG